MSKFRISLVATLILAAVVCAVWAKPKAPTQKQKDGKAACDYVFNICFQSCGTVSGPDPLHPNLITPNTSTNDCQNDCINQLATCYGKIGIEAAPGTRLPNGLVRTPQGTLTQASPTATPRGGVRQPQGTLTQASPTATPKRLVRQPQGTLTQASPSASPNKILSATPKKSPSPTTQKKKH
jgi:hypothetical protein